MATLSVAPARASFGPLPGYGHDISPHGSTMGTNQDEPFINSMSPSPVSAEAFNQQGEMSPATHAMMQARMSNNGRRASSPAALYQPAPMTSFIQDDSYLNMAPYQQQMLYGHANHVQPSYAFDRPALPNHSFSHTVGPTVPTWSHDMGPIQGRSAQNGMNASSFRRGSLGYLPMQQNQGVMGYSDYPPHPHGGINFGNSFHHNTMYDTYQVKHRKRTSPEQLSVLEKSFDENCKPSAVTRKMLADQIGMTPRSVQVWFQNRRQKRKMLDKKKAEDDDGTDSDPKMDIASSGYPAMLHIRGEQDTRNGGERSALPGNHELDGWSSRHPGYDKRDGPSRLNQIQSIPQNGVNNPVHSSPYHQPPDYGRPHPLQVRTNPAVLQGRRGSLPYPPPVATSPNGRVTSPAERPARSQIPMHLAMTLGGRRASLPTNARSFSLGSFTPPRTGASMQRPPYANKRELSPILDQDAQSHFDPNMLSTFSPLESQPSATMTSPMNGPLSVPGPLPNPGFSFGNNDPNAMPPPEFNDPSLPLMTPIVDQQGLPTGNMMYRENRIGSMASMFSQGTMESADTVGDWDVPYHYGAGLDQDAAQILRPEDSLSLPIDFDASARRASAPADMLQKVNLGEVQKRHSPLNPLHKSGFGSDGPSEQKHATDPRLGYKKPEHSAQHHNSARVNGIGGSGYSTTIPQVVLSVQNGDSQEFSFPGPDTAHLGNNDFDDAIGSSDGSWNGLWQ